MVFMIIFSNSLNKNESADKFKSNTEISLVESKIGGKAMPVLTYIAFTISFIFSGPNKAKQIPSMLATLFIEQNDRARIRGKRGGQNAHLLPTKPDDCPKN